MIDRNLLDPVTLVEAQPHYLAIDVTGGPNPCPQRFGVIRQGKDVVPVPAKAALSLHPSDTPRSHSVSSPNPLTKLAKSSDGVIKLSTHPGNPGNNYPFHPFVGLEHVIVMTRASCSARARSMSLTATISTPPFHDKSDGH